MIKVKIVLNEEKIINEKIYDLEKMWESIDAAFLSKNIQIEEKGLYTGTDHPHDYANFGLVCMALEDTPWLLDNLIEWKFYINDMSQNEEKFTEEDFLQQALKYRTEA